MILQQQVGDYLAGLRPTRDVILADMEAYAAEHRVPIASPEVALLLAMLARASGARLVLEIGVAIGYSSLQIARALPGYGKVVGLELDMHMASVARTFLARDPAGARVEILLGDARETLQHLRETFDLVFIDAGKEEYPEYVDLALPRVRRTGLIVIDNLLMDGLVAGGQGNEHWSQTSVDAARALSAGLAADTSLDFILVPLGDGVGILQRR